MTQDVLSCAACDRKTPAARATCIYCCAPLSVASIESAPSQRNIDSFESAFNAVVEPARDAARDQLERAESRLAAALNMERDEARQIIASGKRIPVARSRTRREAELIAALVRTCGLGATVVADQELALQRELARARKVAVDGEALTIAHSGEPISVPAASIILMVSGAFNNRRVDYIESVSGSRSGSAGVLDSSEFFSSDILLDVYADRLECSFRIKFDAFDYSGLLDRLSFRAEENHAKLIDRLRALAPRAVLDDDYARVRNLLRRAWPERARSEARGIKRTGLSLRPVARASVISDSSDQFARYSRLMFLSARP